MNSKLVAKELIKMAKDLTAEISSNDIVELQEGLEELDELLNGVIEKAQELESKADRMGGEISRVVGGQLNRYFIGHMKSFKSNTNQAGSIASLNEFIEKKENWSNEE